jgi:hypothetical protein
MDPLRRRVATIAHVEPVVEGEVVQGLADTHSSRLACSGTSWSVRLQADDLERTSDAGVDGQCGGWRSNMGRFL